jgi:hypothetical protein
MGKSDAPAAPDYKGQAIAQGNSGKYDETTPYGSINWSLRPGADPNNPQPGDYIRNTTLAPEQQQLYSTNVATQLQAGLAGQKMLGDLGDSQTASDAAYRKATQYYDTNFGRDENALRSQLINSGLTEGSEAYTNAMGQFNQRKDSAYANAADRAVAAGDSQQNSAVARLANILAISRGQSPTSGNSSGGQETGLLQAANNQYQAQLGQVNADNAQAAGTNSAIGSVAMIAAMYF